VYREELTAWHTLGRWPTLVGPTSFLQVNDEMAERLYRRVLDLPYGGHGEAVDAYCGVGILTRSLADKFEKVTGIEFDAQSIKLARTTARRLEDCRVAWIAEAAEAVFGEWKQKSSKQSGCKPDLVVLDPPRKGCQREVLQALNILRPKDVVYISCHPAALARDLKILCDRQFAVVRVEPFDLFPQTHHVETLVHLKS
jgi:23S rRNA (uracil1939-C5)-methyltransferase